MKRKDFFKAILGVTAAVVVAPSVLAKEEKSDAEKMLDGARNIDKNLDDEVGRIIHFSDKFSGTIGQKISYYYDKQQMQWFKFQSEIDKQFPG